MAVFIDPFSPLVNSYVSIVQADFHLSSRPFTESWDNSAGTPDAYDYVADGSQTSGSPTVVVMDGTGDWLAGDTLLFGDTGPVYTVAVWDSGTLTITLTANLQSTIPGNTKLNRMSFSEKEQGLVWATEVLNSQMCWFGSKKNPSPGTGTGPHQKLDWPRSGVTDPDGYTYTDTEVPEQLADATAEMALYLLERNLAKPPDLTGLGFSEAEIPGPLKVKVSSKEVIAMIPTYMTSLLIDFGELCASTGNQSFKTVSLVRA